MAAKRQALLQLLEGIRNIDLEKDDVDEKLKNIVKVYAKEKERSLV